PDAEERRSPQGGVSGPEGPAGSECRVIRCRNRSQDSACATTSAASPGRIFVARSYSAARSSAPEQGHPFVIVLHYRHACRTREPCRTPSALLGAEPGRDRLGPAAEAVLPEQPVEVRPHRAVRETQTG